MSRCQAPAVRRQGDVDRDDPSGPPGGHDRARDGGFTLLELLVVMIIIGILAGIAVPVYLQQRAKAHDASTKADVSALGKEVAGYFVDGTGAVFLDFSSTPGHVEVHDGATFSLVKLTNGTAVPTSGAFSNLGSESLWCVSLTDPEGQVKDFKYTAYNGLEVGTC